MLKEIPYTHPLSFEVSLALLLSSPIFRKHLRAAITNFLEALNLCFSEFPHLIILPHHHTSLCRNKNLRAQFSKDNTKHFDLKLWYFLSNKIPLSSCR